MERKVNKIASLAVVPASPNHNNFFPLTHLFNHELSTRAKT